MISKCCNEKEVAEILSYIGDDKTKEPYLYANLKRYELTTPHIDVWAERENAMLRGVYLLYYDCLHFYTRNMIDAEENFLKMVKDLRPKVIMLPEECLSAESRDILTKEYLLEENQIIKLTAQDGWSFSPRVRVATADDIGTLVDLITADSIYKNVYNKDTLFAQTKNRINDGSGKTYILQEQEGIGATYAVYVETDDMVLLSGLLTHPQYRRKGLAQEIMHHVQKLYAKQDVAVISFCEKRNTPSVELHKKEGCEPLTVLCKFVLK